MTPTPRRAARWDSTRASIGAASVTASSREADAKKDAVGRPFRVGKTLLNRLAFRLLDRWDTAGAYEQKHGVILRICATI